MVASPIRARRPGGWSDELLGWFAIARKTVMVELRYRNKFTLDVIGHFVSLAPIALTAWAFSGGRHSTRLGEAIGLPDHFSFILLGFIAFSAIGLGNTLMLNTGTAFHISWEQETGVFERNLTTPVRRGTVLLGYGTYFTALFTYHAVTLFLFGWLVFGLEPAITTSNLGLALVALASLVVITLALGVIGSGLILAFKDDQLYLLLMSRPMTILSGAYFLIDLAPQPFRALALANPLAYAIDAFRGALTGQPLLTPNLGVSLAAAIAVAAGLAVISVPLYQQMLRRMGRRGTLGLF